MKTGKLGICESDPSRYAIGIESNGRFFEYDLHCGDCFEIQMELGKWLPVRIEMDHHDEWYLIDEQGKRHDMPWMSAPARIAL
jgi:hypothetical protein